MRDMFDISIRNPQSKIRNQIKHHATAAAHKPIE
jgi:hypothetical protein